MISIVDGGRPDFVMCGGFANFRFLQFYDFSNWLFPFVKVGEIEKNCEIESPKTWRNVKLNHLESFGEIEFVNFAK